ncbi:MAG: indole-3-glycerol phosphate synthase TrpC [Micrococcaceae bacterium]
MESILQKIISGVQEDLQARQRNLPLEEIQQLAQERTPALDSYKALNQDGFQIIAEIKRSSPSKGILAAITDPAELATQYVRGGAAMISVLTEERRFMGTLDDLKEVRQAVDIPILRKDFMVDEYQFYEARAYGADMTLLIASALDDAQLKDFYQLSHELEMDAMIETHSESELERAANLGANIIGVNVRNLKNLAVDPQHFTDLRDHFPDALIVAESGVTGEDVVTGYAIHGAKAALVGEALVRGNNPTQNVQNYIAAGNTGLQMRA